MENKFTPGSWEPMISEEHPVEFTIVATELGRSVAHIACFPDAWPNARLIAAAPELLDKCRAAKILLLRLSDVVCNMDAQSIEDFLREMDVVIDEAVGGKS